MKHGSTATRQEGYEAGTPRGKRRGWVEKRKKGGEEEDKMRK